MSIVINLGIILIVLWIALSVTKELYHVAWHIKEDLERLKPERVQICRNHIMIKGKMYYPKRTGHHTDCKKECKLAQHCRRDGYGICVTLDAPFDDVIMTDGPDD